MPTVATIRRCVSDVLGVSCIATTDFFIHDTVRQELRQTALLAAIVRFQVAGHIAVRELYSMGLNSVKGELEDR